jgi:hypothetical protein
MELIQRTETEDQRTREDDNIRGGENCWAELRAENPNVLGPYAEPAENKEHRYRRRQQAAAD